MQSLLALHQISTAADVCSHTSKKEIFLTLVNAFQSLPIAKKIFILMFVINVSNHLYQNRANNITHFLFYHLLYSYFHILKNYWSPRY